MPRIYEIIISAVTWFALILQFIVMLANPEPSDVAMPVRIVRFFSYFTILVNMLVAVTTTATAFFPETKLGIFSNKAQAKTAVATYISIVGLVYSLFLRSVWDPLGWQAVADHLLHDVTPIMYVFYWVFFANKTPLTWLDPFKWLTFPFIYMIYSIIRGAFVGWYPYYFADAGQLGYPRALLNAFFVLLVILLVGSIFTVVGKSMSTTAKAPAS